MYIQALKLLYPALKENKLYSGLVLLGTLLMIGLSVCFMKWREAFYNSIQKYDTNAIYIGLGIFTGLALIYVFIYGLTAFYTRYLEFGTRKYLFNQFIGKSLDLHNGGITVVEQRIQDDPLRFARTAISLLKTVIDSIVRLPVFLFMLASVAQWWTTPVVLLYALIGTYLSQKVAKKLVNVEYIQESLEAELRRDLIKYNNGQTSLVPSLKDIIGNWNELALRQKHLSWYTNFYDQISVIFPYCMLVPLYLNHTILLGTLFATSSAIGQVLNSLSVLVSSRDVVVDLQMVTRRLDEMK